MRVGPLVLTLIVRAANTVVGQTGPAARLRLASGFLAGSPSEMEGSPLLEPMAARGSDVERRGGGRGSHLLSSRRDSRPHSSPV
jgi:hypothetical protein